MFDMKITRLRLAGIRCFDDTGDIELSSTCNILVGQNNAGKSTMLRGILQFQGFVFDETDVRPYAAASHVSIVIEGFSEASQLRTRPGDQYKGMQAVRVFAGNPPESIAPFPQVHTDNHGMFAQSRPGHYIVPFAGGLSACRR